MKKSLICTVLLIIIFGGSLIAAEPTEDKQLKMNGGRFLTLNTVTPTPGDAPGTGLREEQSGVGL